MARLHIVEVDGDLHVTLTEGFKNTRFVARFSAENEIVLETDDLPADEGDDRDGDRPRPVDAARAFLDSFLASGELAALKAWRKQLSANSCDPPPESSALGAIDRFIAEISSREDIPF